MLNDQKDLLAVFNSHGVRYLIVGAHAVGVHAEPRGTKDLDLFIEASTTNSEAVFAALAEFGAPLAGMTPADFNDAPGSVFQMGTPPSRIDILQITMIYVAPSQIVAIMDSPDVGACPTTLITMSQSVYVRESPAEVKQKLEAVMSLSLLRCLGDGSLLGRTE